MTNKNVGQHMLNALIGAPILVSLFALGAWSLGYMDDEYRTKPAANTVTMTCTVQEQK